MGRAADALIEDIYDAVTFPERWSGVLQRLCASTGATSGFLFTASACSDAQGLWARHNISDGLLSDYTTHFRHRDLWTNVAATRGLLSHCGVWRSEDIATETELQRSAIFNDLLNPHGIGRLCAVTLADGGELAALQPVLSLYRSADAPSFSDEAARLLKDCAPHLQRAMRLRVRLWKGDERGEAAWSARMIERLPMGVVLLDGRARIVAMNRIGQAIVDARDGLRSQHGGLLADRRADAGRLAGALDAAVAGKGQAAFGQAADLRVWRPSGRAPYMLTVLPLSDEAADGAGNGLGVATIRAAVHIVDPSTGAVGLEARLGSLFRLTPAEVRLVVDLLHDLTPAQSGDRRGVAVSTVRSQLRSVFAKTGTTRQSELMNLMNRCLMLPARD